MKSPVSVFLIVKNEPLLEQCILSFKDYVQELVVIDTGSTDGITQDIAKKYADYFEIYTDCNDPKTGLIEDFSKARNYALSKVTQKYALWADADDLLVGMEKLGQLLPQFESHLSGYDGIAIIFPYEYSYDEFGTCICRHYRERLILNKENYQWINPVHEVLVPKNNCNILHISNDEIIFKHQRQYSNKQVEPGRNLRILEKYVVKVGDSDARQFYYIGLEYCNVGMIEKSIEYLTKYVGISGWSDEVVMACLKLVDIYQALGQYEEGLKWAFKCIEKQENWAEGYFALARMFYFLAEKGGAEEKRNWEKCVYFVKLGLTLPPTQTLLFINPLEREYDIHRYLNMALNKIGDVKGALDSCNTALSKRTNDEALLLNKKIYQAFLTKQEIISSFIKLKEIGELDNATSDLMTALLNKQLPPNAIAVAVQNTPEPDITEPIATIFPKVKISTWSVPDTWDYGSYPLDLTTEQLQAVVIMIWKQYMLHDEVLSAISFLEKSPYRIRHSFATQKALKLTKDCLVWMDKSEDFEKVNSPGTIGEAGTPLPHAFNNSAEAHRFELITSKLTPNSSIVDFGSMDGGYTNRYGLLGHKAVGLDGCEHSVGIARKKAIEFNTGAQFIHTYFQEAMGKVPEHSFDCATSTDTYEHLKDPVNDMLLPAKEMLKSNGRFLLATPHGAWMKGQYVPWAHPWLWEKEGSSWLKVSPRAHLVAPSVWTVAEHFKQAGYWVKNCYVDLCGNFRDVEGQGNVFAEAYAESPNKIDNKLDIIIFTGNGVEEWTAKSIEKSGMGGSETLACAQAKNLAALGHKVRVYNSCGESGEGIYDGVEYYQTEKFQDLQCDVLIISRQANYLGEQYNIEAKLKLLWVHDTLALNATNELLLKADRILALSEWHKNNLIQYHNLHPDHIIVTRNGIDLSRFDHQIKRDRFKCINSSSPDRSWPVLLDDIWPRIKTQVPEATLHLYYGFLNWEHSAKFMPGHPELIDRIKNKIKELEPMGVVFHDRVDQKTLAEEMLSSGCLLYPTFFSETYFIGGAEAQAAGLRIISSTIAAINETVGDRGILIPGDWTSKPYQDQFVEAAVKALQDTSDNERQELHNYARDNFDLIDLAKKWEEMIYSLIEQKLINPIISYQPTERYK